MTEHRNRRVIANVTLTLDDRAAGPRGENDMAFVLPHTMSDGTRDGIVRLTEATTAVMGRKTYEGFAGYWPSVARDGNAERRDRTFAQWLDSVQKVVVTTTLSATSWPNSRVAVGQPATVINELRAEPGGDIVVLASLSVIRQLLDADEVDRLSINLVPELVGGGARLFDDGVPASSWTLASAHPSDTGAIWLYYDRKRAESGGRIVLTRLLDASPDEAWQAWNDESLLRRWWGPAGFTCPRADVDLRVAGSTVVTMQAPPEFGGFQVHNQWRFTVVDRPTRIQFISTFVDAAGNTITPAAAGLPSGVPDEVPHIIELAPSRDGKTQITVTEDGYTSENVRAQSEIGQAQCLDKMQALFNRASDR
jgi:uncharacterized protein YndB with AHSA1/START domain/dihydrofolate reductase